MTRDDNGRSALSIGIQTRLDWLRSRMWFIPGVFAIGATIAAFVLVPADRLLDQAMPGALSGVLFVGGPESARLVLATIGTAMLSFTGLVFTVTMLVLQLASGQLSPRVMRTFLRDRTTQSVLGLFVATFLYSLLVLREVRSPVDGWFVPAITVTVAYLLLVASVGAFVFYIHHMAQAMRAVSVLGSVGDETRAAIDRLYPERIGEEPESPIPGLPARAPDQLAIQEDTPGVLISVDEEQLMAIAGEHALTVALLHQIGDFVPQGAPLLALWSRADDPPDETLVGQLAGAVQIGRERTMTQDAAFGFRQIVDIAERALSPGVNDPTTALQALDQIHDLLRRLAVREFPSPSRLDENGDLLLYLPRPGWPDYVALAIDEIRQYGSGSIQIARRLRHLLLDVQTVAPAAREEPIVRQLRLLDAGIAQAFLAPEDRLAAAVPSASGQGPAEDPFQTPPSGSGAAL
ncbi:MAG: DUF2254 domain-containing protein [Chloroflexi bacterium]|nr:DUF2254 domain-containing protein [Chloroflexota bacterium]